MLKSAFSHSFMCTMCVFSLFWDLNKNTKVFTTLIFRTTKHNSPHKLHIRHLIFQFVKRICIHFVSIKIPISHHQLWSLLRPMLKSQILKVPRPRLSSFLTSSVLLTQGLVSRTDQIIHCHSFSHIYKIKFRW